MEMERISLAQFFDGMNQKERFAAYRELWARAGRLEILTDFPLHLDIELSGACNLRCEWCFQNGMLTGKLGLMDPALFRNIIDQGVPKGLCAIKLQVRGESFLDPNIIDNIKYAKSAGVLDVQITTNGTLLTSEMIDRVLTSGLDALILSYDDHHEDSIKKYNSSGRMEIVETVIDRVLSRRKELGVERPWVRIQGSIPEEKYDEADKLSDRILERYPDADLVTISKIHSFEYGGDALPDLLARYELLACGYLFQRMAIFFDGRCTTCCTDYNARFNLGNATTQNIQDIWNSPSFDEIRRRHLTGERPLLEICNKCHLFTKHIATGRLDQEGIRHAGDKKT